MRHHDVERPGLPRERARALRSVMRAALRVAIVACTACAPSTSALPSTDASCYLRDVPFPPEDAWRYPAPIGDCGTPSHLDCFGGYVCDQGALWEIEYGPIPVCGPFAGPMPCPRSLRACQCAVGCREGAFTDHGTDPMSLCTSP